MDLNYDEDLNENVFFQVLREEHEELFQKATAEGWVICVPRSGSFPKYALTDDDIFSHVLVPNCELPESHFRTLNDKNVRICNRVVIIDEVDIPRPFSTHILFEETFYTDDLLKYKVLCIENPLDQNCSSEDVGVVVVQSLQDCITLLYTEGCSKDVLMQLDDCIANFLKEAEGIVTEPLQNQRDQTSRLYSKCLQIVLQDERMREKTTNKHFLQNVKLSVETYMHHGIYPLLIKGVTACLGFEDASFNKIVRNVSDLQLQDLEVRKDLYDTVPKAKQELARIDRYCTVLGKLGCLRKTLAAISRTCPGKNATPGSVINADDLLPMMVFLVVKSGLANWISNLIYLKKFRFSANANCQTDEPSFLITSLEAAIEHVKSGALLGPSEPESYYYCLSNCKQEGEACKSIDVSQDSVSKLETLDFDQSIAHLFEQIKLGNMDKVANVLNNVTQINEKVEVDSSLCHPLCSCHKCELLLSKVRCATSPTIYSCDDRGFTALHVACMYGQPQIVDFLLTRGASLNVSDFSGSTPLHYAAARGHQNAVLLLAHANAEIQATDNEENTPLHLSAGNGHDCCVKALLYFAEQVGVQLNINAMNSTGDTPLHFASRWGYQNIVKILLEYGASPNLENKRKLTASHYAHNLHISKLLAEGSSKNNGKASNVDNLKLPQKSKSAMPIAVVNNEKLDFSGDRKSSFSSCKSNIQIGIRPKNTDQITKVDKLLRAIALGDTRLACYYLGLDEPSSGDPTDRNLSSLCHPLCLCEKCRLTVSECSTNPPNEHVALDVNMCDSEGFTPLHIASMHGQSDIIYLLLNAGALPNLCTWPKGLTPLHVACQNQRVGAARILIRSENCQLNVQDSRGNTALHYACIGGNSKIVELLLLEGASQTIKNGDGKTPLDAAREKMELNVVRLLKERGDK